MEPGLERFDDKLEKVWSEILDNSQLVKLVREGNFDRRLYALYMIETFHYTTLPTTPRTRRWL